MVIRVYLVVLSCSCPASPPRRWGRLNITEPLGLFTLDQLRAACEVVLEGEDELIWVNRPTSPMSLPPPRSLERLRSSVLLWGSYPRCP